MCRSRTCPEPTSLLPQAAAIDERIARGEAVGPLAGVPIAIKVSALLQPCSCVLNPWPACVAFM